MYRIMPRIFFDKFGSDSTLTAYVIIRDETREKPMSRYLLTWLLPFIIIWECTIYPQIFVIVMLENETQSIFTYCRQITSSHFAVISTILNSCRIQNQASFSSIHMMVDSWSKPKRKASQNSCAVSCRIIIKYGRYYIYVYTLFILFCLVE